MKKLYISLILLISYPILAEEFLTDNEIDITIELQETVIDSEQDTESDRALFAADDDDFFGDSLDKMIEMGAVKEEIKVKPMPIWKAWLLRFGSSLLAKIETFKKFMIKKYDDAKYIVVAAWAKVSGKKLSQRMVQKEKKNKKNAHPSTSSERAQN